MDMLTKTSLEALLLKATNPRNQNVDKAAVDAFCTLINKEKDGAHIGVKVLANRLPEGSEKEMLQTLNILDTCMSKCGSIFQSEIGKFRFLNEMIKLVSPKYLGSHTPLIVKQKVLQLLYVWTLDYPKENKIKEAYDMLRKQGVIREIPNPNVPIPNNMVGRQHAFSILEDDDKSKVLKKLLQSKDPQDIQAANWLIKSMVKEEDKQEEVNLLRTSQLESVKNSVELLNEMMNSYTPGVSSAEELDLIKELHQNCEQLRSSLLKIATETLQTEEALEDILQATHEITEAFNRFDEVILDQQSFLDGSRNALIHEEPLEGPCPKSKGKESKSELDVLCDVFNSADLNSTEILQPTSVLLSDKSSVATEAPDKFKALEELDALSEQLLKDSLPSKQNLFNKNQEKIPMNLMTKVNELKKPVALQEISNSSSLNLDCFLNKPKTEPKMKVPDNGDDFLVDLGDEKMLEASYDDCDKETTVPEDNKPKMLNNIKLSEISIKLEDIKPSSRPPLTILEDRNGLTITLHFANVKPQEDVQVFVVTTINKNSKPVSNYLFQAVVSKDCKLRLQPPSATELPAFNPFLPPAAITQIMLISRPPDLNMFLKFIVSFIVDNETCTEMGEVEDVPQT